MKHAVLLLLTLLFFSMIKAQTQRPRVNHIAFSVSNLQHSTTFYQQIIGLDTIPEPFDDGRHTWFAIGDKAHLHLIQNPGAIIVPSKNSHLCFTVPSVNAFVEKLKKAKIPFEDWSGKKDALTLRVDSVTQIYLQDPDGYWLEINDAKE